MSYTDTHNPDNWPSESELAEDERLNALAMYGPMTEAEAAIDAQIREEIDQAFNAMYPSLAPIDLPF